MKKTKIKKGRTDADELWKVAWTYIRTVVDTLREPFLILDKDLRVLSANKIFYSAFHVTKKETEGELVYNLGNGQWNIPKLKILLEDILPKNTFFEDFKVDHDFQKIGHKIMILNARRIYAANEDRPIILLAMEDITKQKKLEDQLRAYTKRLTVEVAKRTAELEIRVRELERMNKTMVDRELKMVELKKEIEYLKKLVRNGNGNGNGNGKNGNGKNGKNGKSGKHRNGRQR
jgi:chemotaxis protein methyltransferase CheR